MKNFKNFLKAYLKDEEGQTMVEYVLLIVVAAMVIMKLRKGMIDGTGEVVDSVFGQIKGMANQIGQDSDF